MGFSLGDLFMVALLMTNAAAILHEKRFLNKIGWGVDTSGPPDSVKYKLVTMLSAVRMLMRGGQLFPFDVRRWI
jgi:hypothetical protein